MPQKSSKKDHKRSRHAATEGGSRWHRFHFSGKVIVCSCILGFMLILVGGILFAIGQDQDDDIKPDQYDDVRKRPPMVYVGPVLMGIGAFIVIVGILMCLFETNVCRKRSPDASPLINAEAGQIEVKSPEGSASGYDPIQSSPRHKHRKGGGKKSNKTKASKKPYVNSESIQVAGTSSDKEQSKNFLTASDKFLTPPSSFCLEVPVGPEYVSGSQVNKAMLQSLTSSGKSWNTSTEFQTPPASFVDDPMTKYEANKEETESTRDNHKFLSPMQSNASILSDSSTIEGDDGSILDISSKHEFLTPQNSHASILSEDEASNISVNHPIQNGPEVIQAEINVTEIDPVRLKEEQAETSSPVEKSEVLIEKLNEENPDNSPVEEESQPAVVSTESADLLMNDSKESSEEDSKTLQDDSVGDNTKEVQDEKNDSATEKDSDDSSKIVE